MNVAAILKEKGREVVTADSGTTLLAIADLLSEHKIGCVVITAKEGHIAGIISERDIVRAVAQNGAGKLERPVSDCMSRNVVTCREADTIERLMAEMTTGRFRHMPVVEDGKLVGLVSIGDVVKQRIAETEFEAAAMRDYIATA